MDAHLAFAGKAEFLMLFFSLAHFSTSSGFFAETLTWCLMGSWILK